MRDAASHNLVWPKPIERFAFVPDVTPCGTIQHGNASGPVGGGIASSGTLTVSGSPYNVGVSYGAVCVLGALTASIPSRWRPAWAGWWLGIALMAASGLDFTAIGHVVALLLGIGLSYRLPSTAAWTPVRVALLIGGSAFGYFVVSGSSVVTTVAGVGGMLVALLAGRVSRSRDDNEPVPAPR